MSTNRPSLEAEAQAAWELTSIVPDDETAMAVGHALNPCVLCDKLHATATREVRYATW